MSAMPSLEDFVRHAEGYEPFPWEIGDDDEFQTPDMKGKHSVLVSLVRFWKVIAAVGDACPELRTVIDVGPYPGAMIKLLRHFCGPDFAYWAVGLGLSAEYREAMAVHGGKCFETELDPDFVEAAATNEWPMRGADCVLLLDVIEHLTSPVPCLDNINRALRVGGKLILTTDNLTSFANAYQMIRRGRSPNIHPLRSSQFFRGDWRPHAREFSADELKFYLEYSGFSLVSHEYFERKQGDYFRDADGRIVERGRYRGIKGLVQQAAMAAMPHLKDHHLVVATKSAEFEDIARDRPRPTTSMKEWMKILMQAGV